jgi:hypothetical protein
MGMATVVTDVVRENNQTYRLGYTEQCKDGTKMGVGNAGVRSLFPQAADGHRKCLRGPTGREIQETSTASADGRSMLMVSCELRRAASYPEEIKPLPWKTIYRLFKQHSLNNVYDYQKHVDCAPLYAKPAVCL